MIIYYKNGIITRIIPTFTAISTKLRFIIIDFQLEFYQLLGDRPKRVAKFWARVGEI